MPVRTRLQQQRLNCQGMPETSSECPEQHQIPEEAYQVVSEPPLAIPLQDDMDQDPITLDQIWKQLLAMDEERGRQIAALQQELSARSIPSECSIRPPCQEPKMGIGEEAYFHSSNFRETTKEFVKKLDLKPGQKVLDVGCGIGGGVFYMADNFHVEVVGIDLSINMVSFALERAIGRKCSVEFEVADCTKKNFPEKSFDVIYSQHYPSHTDEKSSLKEAIDTGMQFLILASDGLWKVLTNQDAVDSIKTTKDAQTAAKHLIEEALSGKSKDDISCIVVTFH